MAEQLFDVASGGTFPTTVSFDNSGEGGVTLQYVNGLDVSATLVVNGSYQGDDFTDAVQLDSSSVSSGTTGSYRVTGEWDQIQVSVDATTPASGSVQAYKHLPR